MAVRKISRPKSEILELEMSLEFLRKFHPKFWDRMNENDICEMLEICHSIFKANPAILAATNNPGVLPVQ